MCAYRSVCTCVVARGDARRDRRTFALAFLVTGNLPCYIGYTNNGYRVLINGRVKNVTHVTFVEESTKLIC